MMRKRTRESSTEALAIAGDLMLAPMVMWMRMPTMFWDLTGAPNPKSESARAVTEKMAAAREGFADAQLSYLNSLAGFWPDVISGRTPALFSGAATERMMNAALKPSSQRVKSNYRRLKRS